jgi:hypothetical protein
VIDQVLRAVDPVPALQGKTVTGGRLNVGRAVNSLPATVAFAAVHSSGSESTAQAKLTVSLSTPYFRTVTVNYAATGGTARGGGVDYRLASGTLTFNPGETSKTISIAVVDDKLAEQPERIQVTLSKPTNAALGVNTVHTYTIVDNDSTFTALFDEAYYLNNNPDVAANVRAGGFGSGFDHFVAAGQYENRNPSVFFDLPYYLRANPDVAYAVAVNHLFSGYQHFVSYGQREGRNPSPFFDQVYYLNKNPDVAKAVGKTFNSGFEHFVLAGQREGRNPLPYFDQAYYLSKYSDVAAAVHAGGFRSGFEHYLLYGQFERRNPGPLFDEQFYLNTNGDVAWVVANKYLRSGFEHWLLYGRRL